MRERDTETQRQRESFPVISSLWLPSWVYSFVVVSNSWHYSTLTGIQRKQAEPSSLLAKSQQTVVKLGVYSFLLSQRIRGLSRLVYNTLGVSCWLDCGSLMLTSPEVVPCNHCIS